MKLLQTFNINQTSKMVLTEKPPKNAYLKIENEVYRVYYRRGTTVFVQLINIE